MTDTVFARAEPIVADLLSLPGAAREARLAETCGGDAELRREVESLLALDAAASTFLERPALEEAARDADAAPDPTQLVSRQLADYRVDALIGAGGMADVYRVRNLPLERDEALKVLVPSPIVRDADRLRVEMEARAASRLNHPNIVTIFAVGEAAGRHFIAMELVDGETVRQRLGSGPLPVPFVADLAVQISAALAAAHAAGIVHRDLKPENIKITPDGRAKVLDFGIAGREHADQAGGSVAGTAGYMAPEQALGEAARPASDQFSFGVLLHEMLTGRQPFARPARAEMLAAVHTAEPAPVAGLDPDGAALLRRCLAKAPGDRFPSTDALVAACRAWQARVQARGPTRRRVLQAAGIAAVLSVAGIGAWRYAAWSSRRRTVAVLPFRIDSADPDAVYLANGLAATLIERLATLPALAVLPRSLMINFAGTTQDAPAIGRQLAADLVLTGDIRRQGTRLLVEAALVEAGTGASLWSARYDEAAQALLLVEEQIAHAIVVDGVGLRLSADERTRLARRPTVDPIAFDLYLQAVQLCEQETEASYLEARALLGGALDRDPHFGQGHVQMATTYAVMVVDGLERPTEAWPQSSRHTRLALDAIPEAADAHACAASYEFFFNWNWDAAEAEWRQAMRFGGADLHPDLHAARALQRCALGRLDEALALARQARALDPVTPMFAVREADLLLLSGDAAAAAALYEQVLGEAPGDVRALFGLAEATRALGHFDDAVARLRRAYAALGQPDVIAAARLDDDREELRQLEQRGAAAQLAALEARAATGGYVSPLDLARQEARLGHLDAAAAYFPQALADRAPGLAMIDVDRAWQAMRDDPRFLELRRRVGLAVPSLSGGSS